MGEKHWGWRNFHIYYIKYSNSKWFYNGTKTQQCLEISQCQTIGCWKPVPISFVLWLHILWKMQVEKQINNYEQNERDLTLWLHWEREWIWFLHQICLLGESLSFVVILRVFSWVCSFQLVTLDCLINRETVLTVSQADSWVQLGMASQGRQVLSKYDQLVFWHLQQKRIPSADSQGNLYILAHQLNT